MPVKCLLRFVSVLAIGSSLYAVATPSRPNVILVMTDDQGWGDTGYNSHPVLKTPQLDELARTGCDSIVSTPRISTARPRAAA